MTKTRETGLKCWLRQWKCFLHTFTPMYRLNRQHWTQVVAIQTWPLACTDFMNVGFEGKTSTYCCRCKALSVSIPTEISEISSEATELTEDGLGYIVVDFGTVILVSKWCWMFRGDFERVLSVGGWNKYALADRCNDLNKNTGDLDSYSGCWPRSICRHADCPCRTEGTCL